MAVAALQRMLGIVMIHQQWITLAIPRPCHLDLDLDQGPSWGRSVGVLMKVVLLVQVVPQALQTGCLMIRYMLPALLPHV